MDMSFANQALGAEYIVQQGEALERKVYVLPRDIDENIARLKLIAIGIEIDTLTDEQTRYLDSWEEGT
jgi:adenosylhomocysteinase